jgi:hypothetical protein
MYRKLSPLLITNVLLVATIVVTAGCQIHSRISSAVALESGDDVVVEVDIPRTDAEEIKNGEIYFSLVIVDCHHVDGGFPAEPFSEGRRMSDFKFSVDRDLKITGRVPSHIFNEIDSPCVLLRGGSYLGGRLLSKPVPISQRSAIER